VNLGFLHMADMHTIHGKNPGLVIKAQGV
jgi:hypothetical protein